DELTQLAGALRHRQVDELIAAGHPVVEGLADHPGALGDVGHPRAAHAVAQKAVPRRLQDAAHGRRLGTLPRLVLRHSAIVRTRDTDRRAAHLSAPPPGFTRELCEILRLNILAGSPRTVNPRWT